MPSATHQNFVLLFRNHPELVFELARRAGIALVDDFERFEDVAAEVRGLAIDEHIHERIAACSDIDALRELIGRAATITSTQELF